jgi:hypothetical protein
MIEVGGVVGGGGQEAGDGVQVVSVQVVFARGLNIANHSFLTRTVLIHAVAFLTTTPYNNTYIIYASLTYILDGCVHAAKSYTRARSRSCEQLCTHWHFVDKRTTHHRRDRSSSVGGRRATSPIQAHTTTFNRARGAYAFSRTH